jgi:1-deoxy-D-xylulose-5-phosphate reductoisomerase
VVPARDTTKRVLILGSTGSIGRQTIEVIDHLNRLHARGAFGVRHEIVGLAAGKSAEAALAQAAHTGSRFLALADGGAQDGATNRGVRILAGPDAAERLVREVDADIVVGAIVGVSGLGATLAAVEKGTHVALANKETLVAGGAIVCAACARTGARLLPVDSEHSGVWQCLWSRGIGGGDGPPVGVGDDVRRIVLTASGGALRHLSREALEHATVEQALAHPTWSMGAKVTIDSASLTNKALELVEAHWLFGVDADRLGVLIHPGSIAHALVEFADGSVVSQLGSPDMRTPIQYALTHPGRAPGIAPGIDLAALGRLEFTEPDLNRFPALGLGYRVIREGGTSGAVFNAANERAVEAFLAREIPFGGVYRLVERAMAEVGVSPVRSLADVMEADREARRCVEKALAGGLSAVGR